MPTVADAVALLRTLAPTELAEDWDNVGLLAGDPQRELTRVMTCLTLTPDVVAEAVREEIGLVVSHHPLPFRGVKSLATDTIDGGSLWRLAGAGIAVYSPHTAYDSAAEGINAQWAAGLGLAGVAPLVPAMGRDDGAGVGRVGSYDGGDFAKLVDDCRRVSGADAVRVVRPKTERPRRVAIACGSGGSLLDLALAGDGCNVFLTGEMTFHDCLRCRSLGVGVVLVGHYRSERFAVESLAERLAEGLPGCEVFASRDEADPLESPC